MTDKPKSTDEPEVVIDGEDAYAELPIDFDVVEVKKDDDEADTAKAKKTDDEPKTAAKPKDDDDPIEALKRQLDREREARIQAESRASDFEDRYSQASTGTYSSQIDAVESAMALSKSEAERAQKAYADAMEVADYEAAAKAQRLMSRADHDLSRLEEGKRALEYRKKQSEHEYSQRQEKPRNVETMVEQTIKASSPKAQEFIREHRDNLKSTDDVNLLYAAHSMALAKRHAADTPEYFDFISQQMGWGDTEEPKIEKTQRQRTVSAPVSRDTHAANGNLTNRRVTLTPKQVEIANELGISPSAYAKNMLRIQANGKDPSASGPRFSKDIVQ